MLLLDSVFKSLEDGVLALTRSAEKERQDHDKAVSDAEDELAPKFASVGGGGLDETVAVERIRRFLLVLRAVNSPSGCDEPDAIEVIRSVNQMKIDDPQEVLRLEGLIQELEGEQSP